MPIGSHVLVSHVVQGLVERRPAKVLDLGIGFGFYGAAVRQWLDFGILPGAGTELVGVEAWAEYRSPLWELYDRIYCQPIPDFLDANTEVFDAILLLDVIEHFPKAEGDRLIPALKSRTAPNGQLVIGTPAIFHPQGDYMGNPFERHHSLWSEDDFRRQEFEILLNGTPDRFGHEMLLGRWIAPSDAP